jgi:photosystem II stability/assembly factor-like uncharacterized protein
MIYPAPITVNYSNGDKIYNNLYDTNTLTFNLLGIVPNEYIYVSSYNSFYRNKNAGYQIMDVSNITLSGITANNYIINPIVPINANIYNRNLYLLFNGGDKNYDSTSITVGNIYYSISNIIQDDVIIVNTYTSQFANPNVGLQRIDISNVIISGSSAPNYMLQSIIPIYANINGLTLNVIFKGGNKFYNGNYKPGTIKSYVIGQIPGSVATITFYTAIFRDVNTGIQYIDFSNVTLYQQYNNYALNPINSISAIIYPAPVTVYFNNGDKIYNSLYDTGILTYNLFGVITNEYIYINYYNSFYRNKNVGLRIIDISNVTLSGITANNYIINPVVPINAYINPYSIYATFNANDKFYDKTLVTYNVIGTLNGIFSTDNVNINTFTSTYNTSNIGYNRIDISNINLIGININNYVLQPITPIYSNILPKQVTAILSGGDKIYDKTLITGQINYTLSSLVYSDNVILNYNSIYQNYNAGLQLINILNPILNNYIAFNYYLGSINPIIGIISPKLITINFYNINKIYDGVSAILNTISYNINNYPQSGDSAQEVRTIQSDLLYVNSFAGWYRTFNAGMVILDISNIQLLSKFNNIAQNNYQINYILPYNAIIYQRPLYIYFSGGDKIFDGTSIAGPITYYIQNNLNTDDVVIYSFSANYKNINIGYHLIDISNITLSGMTKNNYYVVNIPPIIGLIIPKKVNITFVPLDKIYDNTTIAYITNPIIYESLTFVTVSSYIANYNNIYVESNKIMYISNIILTDFNYVVISPILTLSSNILPKQIYFIGNGDTKIYDKTSYATLNNIYLSGVFNSDISYVSISSYIVYFNNIYVQQNKLIYINNIYITGQLSYNYYIFSNTTTGIILPKPIYGSADGINKKFDNNTSVSIINLNLYNILDGDTVSIINYNSNFINPNIEINKTIIIDNIVLNNYNYTISSIITNANIVYPISYDIVLTCSDIIYKDISNTLSIIFNPLWDFVNIGTDELTGLYSKGNYQIITSRNGIIFVGTQQYITNYIINSLTMTDMSNGLAVCNSGFILITYNNWINYNVIYLDNYNFYASSKIISNNIYVVGLSGIIYRSKDNGLSWSLVISNVYNRLNDIYVVDISNIYIVGNNGLLLKTTNAGNSWLKYNFGNINLNSISMINIYNGYIVGDAGYMYRSNDGINWILSTDISNNNWTNNDLKSVSMFNNNEATVVGLNGTILRTFNRGINWIKYISGTINTLYKVHMITKDIINVVGANGIVLTFTLYIPGILDNQTIINTNITTTLLTSYIPKNYFIKYNFTPTNALKYSSAETNIYKLIVRPIISYPINTLTVLYGNDYLIKSMLPVVDQSGGYFMCNNKYIDISSGEIYFYNNLNVGKYIYNIYYTLNYSTGQTIYNLNVLPTFYYTINGITIIYKTISASIQPYVNQKYGMFTLQDISGTLVTNNLVKIDISSGIVSFNNLKMRIGNYSILITYTLNNVYNTSIYNTTVIPYLNYTPNTTTIDYLINGKSENAIMDPSGGIFSLIDISGYNIITLSSVIINKFGQMTFSQSNSTNLIGRYPFLVLYNINNIQNIFTYTVNFAPYISFIGNLKIIFYEHTINEGIDKPILIPSNGYITLYDISGPLVSNNQITVDTSNNLMFANYISTGLYSFMVIYNYNLASKTFKYNLIVKPYINYSVNKISLMYSISGYIYNSLQPTVKPPCGRFTITEVNSILVQLNLVTLDISSGIISFQSTINSGNYSFNITYTLNGIGTTFIYYLQVFPDFRYTIPYSYLPYDSSGISVIPIYQPLNGLFTISSLIMNNLSINSTTGQITFKNKIDVNIYTITITYALNNIIVIYDYTLYIVPIMIYNITNTTLLYERQTNDYSIIPFVNQPNGSFNLLDISDNNITIDTLSGLIIFSPNINVGIYNFRVIYILNNSSTTINYNLIIKPTLYYINLLTDILYDRSQSIDGFQDNYYIPSPYVNQQFGNFNISNTITKNYISINTISGIITLLPMINVGLYNFIVTYTLNNSFNITNYTVIIRPNLVYTINAITSNYGNFANSTLPYFNQPNGIFNILDTSNIDIVSTGLVIINNLGYLQFSNKIYNGIYNILVYYTLNNVSNSTNYKITIIPNLIYPETKITFLYNTIYYSKYPIYSQEGGIFTIMDLSGSYVLENKVLIDQNTGLITFTQYIDVGIHYFRITYTNNYGYNYIDYQINVIPYIYYVSDQPQNQNNSELLYDRNISYSVQPIVMQLNGLFTILSNNLSQNNKIIIDSITGIIIFNQNIDVGIYNFDIIYTLNNVFNTYNYTLIIIPNLTYIPNNLVITFDSTINSVIPNYNQPNGTFTIQDLSGDLVSTRFVSINTNGIISFNNNIIPSYYKFLVTYTINQMSNTSTYSLMTIPYINYSIPYTNLIYGNVGRSINSVVKPTKGYYVLNTSISDIIINKLTGILTFSSKLSVNIYNISINYFINNMNSIFSYTLTVFPYLNYYNLINTILYNQPESSPNVSEVPNYQQKGGTFNINDLSGTLVTNNKVYIDLSGVIHISNKNNVGIYNFLITYTLNNVSNTTIYVLNVIPNVNYISSVVYILYGQTASYAPYYDQSGGKFICQDVSGYLISNNLITFDNLFGIVNINENYIDVGLYNMYVTYTLNNSSNSTNLSIYILPIVSYYINSLSMASNTSNNSIIPTFVQSNGTFSLLDTFNNSINIDTLSGIIYFTNNVNIGLITITVIYTLNSVYNTTIYNLTVLPLVSFFYPYLLSEYNTTTSADPALFDPVGGTFSIMPNLIDLSNVNIINNYVNNNQMSINNDGILTFDRSIIVDIYKLFIVYTINNVSNRTNFTYTMKPYINYNIGNITCNYHDISYSEFPTVAPNNGTFIATVPHINLIYTGISINKTTGQLRFGFINAGEWTITVKYTVNRVSNIIIYNLIIQANFNYSPPYMVIPYNTIINTTAPTSSVIGGVYSSDSVIPGFTINPSTGVLYFNYIYSGIYFISVTYTIYDTGVTLNYTLLVKPTFIYVPTSMNTYYLVTVYSSLPLFQPIGGIFNATFNDLNNSPLQSNISIDLSSGVINANDTVGVGIYNLAISYSVNGSTETIPFTINVYPIFNYSIGNLSVSYGSYYYSEMPSTNPRRGVFSTNSKLFNIDISNGIIYINNTINVGTYIIPTTYSYNKLKTSFNYNLTINPLLVYSISKIEYIYGNGGSSITPTALQIYGMFRFLSVSGTVPIPYKMSYIQAEDEFINNGIILNGYSGKFNFGNRIVVGFYTFYISYTLNNLSAYQLYTLTVKPFIKYDQSTLILDYNTSAISVKPIVDQSGGFFIFGNTNDLQLEFTRIGINNNTGIINFKKGIKVGNFNITIKYTVNQISNITMYNLNIRPIYYYNNYNQTIVYSIPDNSETPVVYLSGGEFIIVDYNGIDTNNIYIDSITGIIYFNLISVGYYVIGLQYSFNNSSITTNYLLTIKPFIDYPNKIKLIVYSNSGYSEPPVYAEGNGIFGFESITDFGFQTPKLNIDISSGIIFFNTFINIGYYNVYIYYIKNNIKNIFNYNLEIIPSVFYSISGISLIYNNYKSVTISSIIPINNPIKGKFYFTDFSNNLPINISINKSNGLINIFNNIPVGNYNMSITYSLLNFTNITNYYLTILPNYYFTNNEIIIIYNKGTTDSTVPILDPSGGKFTMVYPYSNNLINNFSFKKNGIITFNNYIEVSNYNLQILYTFNNIQSFVNYTLKLKPLFYYLENSLFVVFMANSSSTKPIIGPYGGTFTFSIDTQTSFINVNPVNGTINVTAGIIGGIYNVTISYTYNNISSTAIYIIKVLSKLYYDVSGIQINYGINNQSRTPIFVNIGGLFTVPDSYINKGISIDSSAGILYFSPYIKVNYYTVPIYYLTGQIMQLVSYYLTIIPNLIYDISSISVLYNTTTIINKPYINPSNGYFIINSNSNNNFNVNLSGYIKIINPPINKYNLFISYLYNTIPNTTNIIVTVYPILNYQSQSDIVPTYNINKISYSEQPSVNPLNGIFSIDPNITTSIDSNTGIITFNDNFELGNYMLVIYYTVNYITQKYNYNFIIKPLIIYPIGYNDLDGSIAGESDIPNVYPQNGTFTSDSTLVSNGNVILYQNGQLYFNNNIAVGTFKINVTYEINNNTDTFVYILTIHPTLYYNLQFFNNGVDSYSETPITNIKGGIFYLDFFINSSMNVNAVSIDSDTGIISFLSDLNVGTYYFNVLYILNNITATFYYVFYIKPYFTYNDLIVNYLESTFEYPTLVSSPDGYFQSDNINLYGYLNNYTGLITISDNIAVDMYTITMTYTLFDVSNNYNFNLTIKPIISYDSFATLVYGDTNVSITPTLNKNNIPNDQILGTFNTDTLPTNVLFDNTTGIFTFNSEIDVSIYNFNVTFTYVNITGNTIYTLTILPFIQYSNDSTLIYSNEGISEIPYVYPQGGLFTFGNDYPGILIDSQYGTLHFANTLPVNTYTLIIHYTINNITNSTEYNLFVVSTTLGSTFLPNDKIYDGTEGVKFKSNKLTGVVGDDIVFIHSYKASFLTSDVGINIPIYIYDIKLGGPQAGNYDVNNTGTATGNIYYIHYSPNTAIINVGTKGNSVQPTITDAVASPSYLLNNPPDGIRITPYGVIVWDDTLTINVYPMVITVYNDHISLNIKYTLTVTNNLYIMPLEVNAPIVEGLTIETQNNKLQYNNIKGVSYAISDKMNGLVGSFDLTAYSGDDSLSHDLNGGQSFIFTLPNADPSNNLILYELNDNGTVKYSQPLKVYYIGNNNWTSTVRYLSEFYIQDQNTLNNTPPVFSKNSGNYFSNIIIYIKAKPKSIIYYTLDGTPPTINSSVYNNLTGILITKTTTLKAFAATPGYIISTVTMRTYNISNLPCILSETLIKTPSGYELIDDLKNGDLVITSDNRIVKIINILKYHILNSNEYEIPIIIPKNFFGSNIPCRDTHISENHGIKYQDTWIYGNLNSRAFKKLKTNQGLSPLYYHIELPNYYNDHLIANNLPIESWAGQSGKYNCYFIKQTEIKINNINIKTIRRNIFIKTYK